MKFKVNDTIIVSSGKESGRQGKIVAVLPPQNKVVVEGINKYKKHLKPKGKEKTGSIIERERPLPVAAIALLCPKCKQPTRVGYRVNRDGKKVRICRKCEGEI